MTEVVAALIWNGNKFLACQRPAHKARGLLWEFVGGKVETGETPEVALIRECREELAVTVDVGSVFMDVTHVYPDLTVHLTLFNAVIVDGTPQLLEHNAIKWITTEEIDRYDFCPADVDILARLKGVRNAVDAYLASAADPGYKQFQCSLMPTVSQDSVLGVRMPKLRLFAKHFSKYFDQSEFFHQLPHKYHEENNLHALLMNEIKDYNAAVSALNAFLPYINNWSTCDTISPIAFAKCPAELLDEIEVWFNDTHEYVRRFGISILMKFYLDDHFDPRFLYRVAAVPREEYYVKMMVAWFYATALAKRYAETVVILENQMLDPWTHNKTIQKAIESYRIPNETKSYLRSLKIKQKEGNCHD